MTLKPSVDSLKFSTLTLLASLTMSSAALAAPEATVDVRLSPAGNFRAETKKITGSAKKNSDGSVEAERIEIPVTTLKTGIELRDRHMNENYLDSKQHPNAIVTNAKGKNGKGTATLELRGVAQQVRGNYKVIGNELLVEFPVKISDFKIPKPRYMGVGVKDEITVRAKIPLK